MRLEILLILATDLHILYLMTPLYALQPINWDVYIHIMVTLTPEKGQVSDKLNINVGALIKYSSLNWKTVKVSNLAISIQKFWNALILDDLLNCCAESDMIAICSKYSIARGVLQSLQTARTNFNRNVDCILPEIELAGI